MNSILWRRRAVILGFISIITLLAWTEMYWMTAGPHVGSMVSHEGSGGFELSLMFLMWNIMMMAMMVPTATPMILTFADVSAKQGILTFATTISFMAGYLFLWVAFSVVTTLVHWSLANTALLNSMTMRSVPMLGGILLIGTGIYQWTPLKHRCLRHCRMPNGEMAAEWQKLGESGFGMGLIHGIYDVGCCWGFMALMFVGGLLNLLWMGFLTLLIAVEKVAPDGHAFGRLVGALFFLAGLSAIAASVF